MRLRTRSGFRLSNATRDNLAAILDDFPIPATFLAIGHNAQFNVRHALLPSARNEYQGESKYYPLRHTQSTEKHAGPTLCPEEEYRPPYPWGRRISCSELEPSFKSTPRSAEWFPGWQPRR